MRKKTFDITPAQMEWLEEQAKRFAIPPAEFLRRVLDEALAGATAPTRLVDPPAEYVTKERGA